MNSKRLMMAMAIATCLSAQAGNEMVGDTLVIESPSKVKIETRDTVQRIVISGSKEDPQFYYSQRISIPDSTAVRRTMKSVENFNKVVIKKKDGKPSKWSSSLHLNLGLNALTSTPDEYKFKVWPSFEVGFQWLADYQPYGKKNEWSVGLGLNYRNYQYEKNHYLEKNANNVLVPAACDPAWKDTDAGFGVASLQLPLLYSHYFNDKQTFGITIGAIVNWNFNAQANHEFDEGDNHCSVTTKKIGVKPFTIDGIAIVHIPSFFDVYCKYSPMKLFKDGRGPEAHQLTIGLCL